MRRRFLLSSKLGLKFFAPLFVCLLQPALCMGQDSDSQHLNEIVQPGTQGDLDTGGAYYKNKLEFSLETGALPINIPFPFDFLIGSDYSQNPRRYTLVPIFPSLRWQMGAVRGPGILRGNTDLTLTGSFTAIPSGPETRYGAFDLGVRRNFIPRHWKVDPYFELRGGAGFINAKGPDGVPWAQGGDFTFTLWIGSGVRYNFDSRYSMSTGFAFMHVSDAYLCHPAYCDFGINVVGPVIGFNMRLGKPKHSGDETQN